ncbi:hypothetical protein OAA09_01420 [bacterium]|nr:hypothetical protein [bacterium]
MKVGDLVSCGEETGLLISFSEELRDNDDKPWIDVLWSGTDAYHGLTPGVEAIEASDIDEYYSNGQWIKCQRT